MTDEDEEFTVKIDGTEYDVKWSKYEDGGTAFMISKKSLIEAEVFIVEPVQEDGWRVWDNRWNNSYDFETITEAWIHARNNML